MAKPIPPNFILRDLSTTNHYQLIIKIQLGERNSIATCVEKLKIYTKTFKYWGIANFVNTTLKTGIT